MGAPHRFTSATVAAGIGGSYSTRRSTSTRSAAPSLAGHQRNCRPASPARRGPLPPPALSRPRVPARRTTGSCHRSHRVASVRHHEPRPTRVLEKAPPHAMGDPGSVQADCRRRLATQVARVRPGSLVGDCCPVCRRDPLHADTYADVSAEPIADDSPDEQRAVIRARRQSVSVRARQRASTSTSGATDASEPRLMSSDGNRASLFSLEKWTSGASRARKAPDV